MIYLAPTALAVTAVWRKWMEQTPMRNAMPSSGWKTSRGTMRWGLTPISGAILMTVKARWIFPLAFFGRAPTVQARVISIIPYPTQFVKRKDDQKIKSIISRFCAFCTIDFWAGL